MDGFSISFSFSICVELNIDVKFTLLRYEKNSFSLFYILHEKVNGVLFLFLLKHNQF